jgi:hypothetical protein
MCHARDGRFFVGPNILSILMIALVTSVVGASAQPLVLGANVNVSNIAGAQSEVGVAINPTNRLNLVATANNIANLGQLAVWFSTNGGVTWTANFISTPEDGFAAADRRFDPNAAFDSDGNVYVVYSTTGTGNRLLVARSTDGGQNFNQVTTVTTDAGPNDLHTAMVMTRADAAGADDVLVVWARPQGAGESIEAALSLDAGATFPTQNNNVNDALQRTFLPWAAVDNAGNFHVVWEVNQGGGAGAIFHDTLNGVTLADGANVQVSTVQITDFAAATSTLPAQPDRGVFSVATIDVDRSPGSSGRIFMSYTDRANTATNDTNIFVRFSDNGGATWSARTQVNDDGGTTSQFLPRMAIDQTTGDVFLAWYDARGDAANNQLAHVFVSVSTNSGGAWSANQQLTTAASNESTTNAARDGNNYAEYFGLTADRCFGFAAWTDARAANFTGGTREDVYVASALLDGEDPLLSPAASIQVEQASLAGTPVVVPLPTATDNCDDDVTVTSDAPALFPLGNTVVNFTATDDAGNVAVSSIIVTVVDTTAPTIASVTASPDILWPPNHKMGPVTVSVDVSDVCDAALDCQIVSVSSNEPANGVGDGNTQPDWVITGDLTVDLRAERSGPGSGRVYTITVQCTDDSGNSSSGEVLVRVPHDRR